MTKILCPLLMLVLTLAATELANSQKLGRFPETISDNKKSLDQSECHIMYVAGAGAQVRSKPNNQSKVLAELRYGEKIETCGKQASWAKVDLGWIDPRLLSAIPIATTSQEAIQKAHQFESAGDLKNAIIWAARAADLHETQINLEILAELYSRTEDFEKESLVRQKLLRLQKQKSIAAAQANEDFKTEKPEVTPKPDSMEGRSQGSLNPAKNPDPEEPPIMRCFNFDHGSQQDLLKNLWISLEVLKFSSKDGKENLQNFLINFENGDIKSLISDQNSLESIEKIDCRRKLIMTKKQNAQCPAEVALQNIYDLSNGMPVVPEFLTGSEDKAFVISRDSDSLNLWDCRQLPEIPKCVVRSKISAWIGRDQECSSDQSTTTNCPSLCGGARFKSPYEFFVYKNKQKGVLCKIIDQPFSLKCENELQNFR